MVGYFAYSLAGPFFGEIMRGIEDTFNACEEEMVACCCSSSEKKVTRLLRERMVDGAIIFVEHLDDSLIELIAGSKCPVVVMDRELCGEFISSVTVDNRKAAYEVGKYIYEQGFSSVGCIVGEGPDAIQRDAGIREAIRDFGLQLREDWVISGSFVYAKAYEKVRQMLEAGKEPPQVFFAFNDEMAMGAISALREKGYRVPEDVSVIGMDDILQARVWNPPLTTYHRPIYEHGVQAAKLLLQMIKEETPGSSVRLSGHMQERDSCRKAEHKNEE